MPPPEPILLLGDTQLASPFERLILRRERNEAARQRLIAHAAEERFGLFVHLGDAVFDGGSAREWAAFDRLAAPLRARAPSLLVPGNHDYWRGRRAFLRHAGARFPIEAGRPWREQRYGRLALVCLDSNRRALGRALWREQGAWYRTRLAELETDPAIAAIAVCAHHPPFTNSRVSGDARHVQRAFLAPFLNAAKTRAFLSGHAHGYERFEREGKAFVVSGGGGGPRVRYRTGRRRRHAEAAAASGNGAGFRPFHYLLLEDRPDGSVEIRAKGFDGTGPLAVIDRWAG